MYTKSMRVKDVNGNEVVIGGEEIFRAYKDLVQWFMETRFVWIFNNFGERFNRTAIKHCARKCAEVVTINPEMTSTSEPDDSTYLEFDTLMDIFNKYRNGDFNWLKDWEPETKVIVIKEDNKSQED